MAISNAQVFEFLSLAHAMHAIESFSAEGFEVSLVPIYRMNVWTGKAEIDKYNMYIGKNNRLTTECLYERRNKQEE